METTSVSTLTQKADLLKLHDRDNVAVALHPIEKGSELTINQQTLIANQDIPQGHKIALNVIQPNENIVKYGYPIGHATELIQQGAWLHTHNVKTNLSGELDYHYEPDLHPTTYPKKI